MLQVQSMRSSITWPGEDMRRGAEEGTVVEDVGVVVVPGTGNKAPCAVVTFKRNYSTIVSHIVHYRLVEVLQFPTSANNAKFQKLKR